MHRVFRIRSKNDLRLAYDVLQMVKKLGVVDVNSDYIKSLKQDIREFLRLDTKEAEYIHRDDYGYATIRAIVPDYCKTKDDIEQWFDECLRMECTPSPYDCTGQLFTVWHKIVKLHGQNYIYHHIGMDV